MATGSLPTLVKAKLTTLLFITCSLKSEGSEAVIEAFHYLSFSPPIPSVLARTSLFFFSVEALKGFPPQQNSDHYLGFNSKLLGILKCSKAFDSFSTSLTHKCIVFVMHISHQKLCKICICYRKKVRKK